MLAERTLLIICHCVEIILIHCTTIKDNEGLKNIMHLSYETHELAQNIIMVYPKHIMRREGRGKGTCNDHVLDKNSCFHPR